MSLVVNLEAVRLVAYEAPQLGLIGKVDRIDRWLLARRCSLG